MAIYIRDISIRKPNWLDGEVWTLNNLNEVTVIFGKNGSGKSQLLRSFRDKDNKSCHYISPERAGEIQLDVSISQLEMEADKRAGRRTTNLADHFRQESISRIQTLLIKIGFYSGRNQNSSINLDDIENFINLLLPDFRFNIINRGMHLTPVPTTYSVL